MAFDGTYLTATLNQMTLHGQRGLVGGTWGPTTQDNAFLNLDPDKELSVAGVKKASQMMEWLCWCPSAKRKCTLPLLSLPAEHNFEGCGAQKRGNWYVLETVGRFLSHNQDTILAVIFDAHGTHQYVRRVLHGNLGGIDRRDLQDIPFFGQIVYEELPSSCLPRIPMKTAKVDGKPFHAFPGVCALYLMITFCRTEPLYVFVCRMILCETFVSD